MASGSGQPADMPSGAVELEFLPMARGEAIEWRLGAPGLDQTMYALYWRERPPCVDERLPPGLDSGLAAALCELGAVTFLTDTPPAVPRKRSRWRDALSSTEAAWELDGEAWRRPVAGLNEPWLACTRAPEVARELFSIGAWHLATAQVVFVSDPDRPPPILPDALVRRVVQHKDWAALAPELAVCGVRAVLTQGHDGACLGVLPLAVVDWADRFASAVGAQALARGWSWIRRERNGAHGETG